MSNPIADTCRNIIVADVERVLGHYPLPQLAGKRVFLTGGTGFFGYWLLMTIARLNAAGAQLRLSPCRATVRVFWKAILSFSATWLQFIHGDVNCRRRWKNFDLFIHGASDTSPEAAQRALELFDSIVQGTRHVLDHAVACKTRRVLIISSGAAYGDQPADITHIPEILPTPAVRQILPMLTAKASVRWKCWPPATHANIGWYLCLRDALPSLATACQRIWRWGS